MPVNFGWLIDRYGVPGLLIPNTPAFVYDGGLGRGAVRSEHPAEGRDPFGSRTLYYRIPMGSEPFLLVGGYVRLPRGRVGAALARLDEMRIVVFDRFRERSPSGGTRVAVEVAVAADVRGVGREELDRAIAERRVLDVSSYREMGDGYVSVEIVAPGGPLPEHGHVLVFDPPCRLTEEELSTAPHLEVDSADEFIGRTYRKKLPFPLDP